MNSTFFSASNSYHYGTYWGTVYLSASSITVEGVWFEVTYEPCSSGFFDITSNSKSTTFTKKCRNYNSKLATLDSYIATWILGANVDPSNPSILDCGGLELPVSTVFGKTFDTVERSDFSECGRDGSPIITFALALNSQGIITSRAITRDFGFLYFRVGDVFPGDSALPIDVFDAIIAKQLPDSVKNVYVGQGYGNNYLIPVNSLLWSYSEEYIMLLRVAWPRGPTCPNNSTPNAGATSFLLKLGGAPYIPPVTYNPLPPLDMCILGYDNCGLGSVCTPNTSRASFTCSEIPASKPIP